jgi:ribosomal protein S18 acetylase RimI-like enzyme
MPQLSTQAWYERRGYRTIREEPGFYNETEVPEAKAYEGFVARTVFMRMDLV